MKMTITNNISSSINDEHQQSYILLLSQKIQRKYNISNNNYFSIHLRIRESFDATFNNKEEISNITYKLFF